MSLKLLLGGKPPEELPSKNRGRCPECRTLGFLFKTMRGACPTIGFWCANLNCTAGEQYRPWRAPRK